MYHGRQRIVVGFRDQDGILQTTETFETLRIPRMSVSQGRKPNPFLTFINGQDIGLSGRLEPSTLSLNISHPYSLYSSHHHTDRCVTTANCPS